MLRKRMIMLGALGALAVTTFCTAGPAQAGVSGRRNTMIAAGAVAAYGLLTDRPEVAIAGAVGTAVAYNSYHQARQREEYRDRWRDRDNDWRDRDRHDNWRDRDRDNDWRDRDRDDNWRDRDRGNNWHGNNGRGSPRGWHQGRHNPHRDD